MKMLRPLSEGELFLQIPTTAICTELKLDPEVSLLTQAFEDIVNQHPLLSSVISNNSDNKICFFEAKWKGKIEEIELNDHQTLDSFLNLALNYKHNINKSLIKIWYLKDYDKQYVVTVISHAVSDARSAAEFVLSGLNRYEELIEGKASPLDRKPIPESIDALLPSEGKTTDAYVEVLKELINRQTYRTLPVKTEKPGKIKHLYHCFSITETQQILTSCKAHGLTFNNAYISAALMSLHALINKDKDCSDSHYLYRILVDLRNRVSPAIEVDCFITAASSLLSSACITHSSTLLSLAKSISVSSKNITEGIANAKLHHAQKVLLRTMTIPQALHLSNAGRVESTSPLPHTEPQNMLMMNGNLPFRTIPLVTNTFNNRLSIDFYYAENYYDKNDMSQFFDQLIENILSIQDA